MGLSDVGKTVLSLWKRSKAFATTPFIWPIISSFTWASVMLRRFWQPLHAAVFQDRTHFLCCFWYKLQADFMKYLELAQNCRSLARFCDWSVYLHVLKWYWLKFSLFTAPLQGAVFYFSTRKGMSTAALTFSFRTSVIVTRKLIIDSRLIHRL